MKILRRFLIVLLSFSLLLETAYGYEYKEKIALNYKEPKLLYTAFYYVGNPINESMKTKIHGYTLWH